MHRLTLCLLAACGLWAATAHSQTYTFTTLAGDAGYGSTDGTGSAARFFSPGGVAVDSAGNVYVADSGNSTIRKITPGGVVTTLAGLAGVRGSADGVGSMARFNGPEGVAVDSAGNVFVADSVNSTIRKVTPSGVVTTLAGWPLSLGSADGTGSGARFNWPNGIAVDSAGNVYVADSDNSTIRKITPGGVVSTLAGLAGFYGSTDGTGSAARFFSPGGVAVDSAGNVFVADVGNSTIRKVTPSGVVTTLAGVPLSSGSADGTGSGARFNWPNGIAVDSAGNVFVADTANHMIRKVTPDGVVSTLAGFLTSGSANGTGSAARFYSPGGVSVDSAGNVFVADTANHMIRKVTLDGVVGTLAGATGAKGSTNGTGSAARFYAPAGVAVDSSGNVFVADTSNHTIRKITPSGVVSTFAGLAGSQGSVDGTGSAARFCNPIGIAVDSSGNVFVADTGNYTIRKITPGRVVSTLAGLAGSVGSADGAGSEARFRSPQGIAVDSAGNLYVADTVNRTIRKIAPDGVVSTLAGLALSLGSTDGVGSDARFSEPKGVAVDSAGNVYVADAYMADTIRKITPDRVVSTLAGLAGSLGSRDGTGIAARFYSPSGVVVDSAGNLYVADSGNCTIRKVTPAGVVSTVAGLGMSRGSADGTGSDARFNWPTGIAATSAGDLYVADVNNNTIRLGRLASLASPSLGAKFVANSLILSWPSSAGNYVLETSSTMSPTPVWTPVTNAVSISGNSFVVTNSLDGGARFYRLRTP